MVTVKSWTKSDRISVVKLYADDKEYNRKADLWKAIKITMSLTEPAEVKINYEING